MKILKPYFYDEFKCIGGDCIDTCCVGWQIEIDKDTLNKYDQVDGEFGEKLKEKIKRGDRNYFKLDENRHCPFLNEQSLCDVYIHIGEDKLSRTCTNYPRTSKKYEDVIEQNLALSCPEIAKLLVMNRTPFDFCFGENEEKITSMGTEYTPNYLLLDTLSKGRGLSVDIMQCREIPMWKRMFLCISIAETIQKHIDNNTLEQIKESLDLFQDVKYLLQYMKELDHLPGNMDIKFEHYKRTISSISSIELPNKTFVKYLNETIGYLNQLTPEQGIEQLERLINDFNHKNQNKEYIFENFIVYDLFHYYMTSYKTKDLHKDITMVFEIVSLLKLLTMVHWFNHHEVISDREYVEIFYSYSRAIEHVSDNYNKIYNSIKEEGYDRLPYMLSLIK